MKLSAEFTRSLLIGFENAYPELLRMASRATGSRDEARDLVHDTWVRLAEHAGRSPASDGQALPRDLVAYLGVMARHLAFDAHRREQRLIRYRDEAALHAQLAPAHAPDAAEALMYRQVLQVLERTLAGLPERSRQVFEAYRVHGEPQPQIAARLGVSLNTVERDLMQAGDCIEDALHRWQGGVSTGSRRPGRRRSLGALLGVLGLGASGVLAWYPWRAWRDAQVQWSARWHSPRGQLQRHLLPDESLLTLDALSRVELQYFASRRAVRLEEGAAFFEVARDAERPFTVQAGAVRVRVLGTRFGVEITSLKSGEQRVDIEVESGRVEVETAPGVPAQALEAGDSVQVQAGTMRRRRMAAQDAAAWREGALIFQDAPLHEALARISRYSVLTLHLSPDAADLRVSGRLRIAQALAWLEALPRVMPVLVRSSADGQQWWVSRSR